MSIQKFLVTMINSEDIYLKLLTPADGYAIHNDEQAMAVMEEFSFQSVLDLVEHVRAHNIEVIGEYQGVAY